MKALTICQPYASLICLPDDDPRAKRVENRRWFCSHRGPLLIHAGKSREYLNADYYDSDVDAYGLRIAEMPFGAIVGIAQMRDCFAVERPPLNRYPWLANHEHIEGPYCFLLQEVRKFPEPIPYRGAQGLFEIPHSVVARYLEPTT